MNTFGAVATVQSNEIQAFLNQFFMKPEDTTFTGLVKRWDYEAGNLFADWNAAFQKAERQNPGWAYVVGIWRMMSGGSYDVHPSAVMTFCDSMGFTTAKQLLDYIAQHNSMPNAQGLLNAMNNRLPELSPLEVAPIAEWLPRIKSKFRRIADADGFFSPMMDWIYYYVTDEDVEKLAVQMPSRFLRYELESQDCDKSRKVARGWIAGNHSGQRLILGAGGNLLDANGNGISMGHDLLMAITKTDAYYLEPQTGERCDDILPIQYPGAAYFELTRVYA